MRFKKLKIFVAVALIIFILIIANIIAFSISQNDTQSKLAANIDSRKNSSIVQGATSQTSVNPNTQSSTTADTSASQITTSQSQLTSSTSNNPPQAPIISHPMTRTRAS